MPFNIQGLMDMLQKGGQGMMGGDASSASDTPGTFGGPGGTMSGPATPYVQGTPSAPTLGAPLGSLRTDPSQSGQGPSGNVGSTLANGDFAITPGSQVPGMQGGAGGFWHKLITGQHPLATAPQGSGLSALGQILGGVGQQFRGQAGMNQGAPQGGVTAVNPQGGPAALQGMLQQLLKGKQGAGQGAGLGVTTPPFIGNGPVGGTQNPFSQGGQ